MPACSPAHSAGAGSAGLPVQADFLLHATPVAPAARTRPSPGARHHRIHPHKRDDQHPAGLALAAHFPAWRPACPRARDQRRRDWIGPSSNRSPRSAAAALKSTRQLYRAGGRAHSAPTTITNVYAILRGTDPAQRQRMVLVTGTTTREIPIFWMPGPRRAPTTMPPGSRVAGVRASSEQAALSGLHGLCGCRGEEQG